MELKSHRNHSSGLIWVLFILQVQDCGYFCGYDFGCIRTFEYYSIIVFPFIWSQTIELHFYKTRVIYIYIYIFRLTKFYQQIETEYFRLVLLLTKVHRLCRCARRTGTDTRPPPAGTLGYPLQPRACNGTRWPTTWSSTCHDRTLTLTAPGHPDCPLHIIWT